MKLRILLRTLAVLTGVFCFVCSAGAAELPDSLAELMPFCKKVMPWNCRHSGGGATLSLLSDDAAPASVRGFHYAVIYVVNGDFPRVGTEPDAAIVRDLLKDGHYVIVADFHNHKNARTPDFDQDLRDIYQSIYRKGETEVLHGTNWIAPEGFRVYIVPSGYRLAVDIPYYDLDKHTGGEGAKLAMKHYNELVGRPSHKQFNLTKVEKPEDMRDRFGKPLDYTVYLDVIYPGKSDRKVPLFVLSGSGFPDSPHYDPESNRINLAGFLFKGYAYAHVHYPTTPVVKAFARHAHVYGMDSAHRYHAYAAGIRTLRVHADQFNFDPERIGLCGVSKAAPVCQFLGDPDSDAVLASRKMPVPQPYENVSSKVSCIALFNGNLSQYGSKKGAVPSFWGRSELDPYLSYDSALKSRGIMEKNGVPHFALMDMTELEHTFPREKDPRMGGLDLDWTLRRFFDHFLKQEGEEPDLILSLPLDGAKDLAAGTVPEVHFFPVMQDVSDPAAAGTLCDAAGNAVPGTWQKANGGICFRYVPESPLKDGTYTMKIGKGWKSVAGKDFQGQKEYTFTVNDGKSKVTPRLLFPVESVQRSGGTEQKFSYFKSYCPMAARSSAGVWSTITYDLGAVFTLDRIEPQFGKTPFSYTFDLETSTDGAKWELILANGNGKFSLERQSIPVKRKVRYIRWTARGGNRIGHFFLAGSRIYGY